MVKKPHKSDQDGYEENGREPYDNPEEHLEIERNRFRGGLPPTPEMYARAREQWYQLSGSVMRPPMNPVIGDSATSEKHPLGKAQEERQESEQ